MRRRRGRRTQAITKRYVFQANAVKVFAFYIFNKFVSFGNLRD